jgi:ABC-type lipoprotein export system ATPase subunit
MMTHANTDSSHRRLISARALGVLGEFDHFFEFKSSGEFVIVYGPNGVGKTRVLEIINALCNLNMGRLLALPFRSTELTFSNGDRLRVRRITGSAAEELDLDDDIAERPVDRTELEFRLVPFGSRPIVSRIDSLGDFEAFLRRSTPFVPIDDRGMWMDSNDGEIVNQERLRRMYQTRFRAANRGALGKKKETLEIKSEIKAFTDSLDVRLIETQRLTKQERESERLAYRDETSRTLPTIIQYSDQIKSSLDHNLSANSRLTQSLDSTFPRRMLEKGDKSHLTEDELRDKWAEQTTRRARLTEIADLNVDPELSLPEGSLNPWQLGMLELYLADADEKLDSFSNVLKRIDLLEEIVNARLLRKSLHIDANNGLVITRALDQTTVPLTALSSGEQHEIILMFDLLFNVRPGSVVMIDEPEISLHIGWQKKFIEDVLRIAALVGFQFIVATHSPQIIDRWWSYATRLGPTSSDFLGDDEADADAG